MVKKTPGGEPESPVLEEAADEIARVASTLAAQDTGTRGAWLTIGAALWRARDACNGNQEFGTWVKDHGIDKIQGLNTPASRSDCLWLAERSDCSELIAYDAANNPRAVRHLWRLLLAETAAEAWELYSEVGEVGGTAKMRTQHVMEKTYATKEEADAALLKVVDMAAVEDPESLNEEAVLVLKRAIRRAVKLPVPLSRPGVAEAFKLAQVGLKAHAWASVDAPTDALFWFMSDGLGLDSPQAQIELALAAAKVHGVTVPEALDALYDAYGLSLPPSKLPENALFDDDGIPTEGVAQDNLLFDAGGDPDVAIVGSQKKQSKKQKGWTTVKVPPAAFSYLPPPPDVKHTTLEDTEATVVAWLKLAEDKGFTMDEAKQWMIDIWFKKEGE